MGSAVPAPVIALIVLACVPAVGVNVYRSITGRDLWRPPADAAWRPGPAETRQRAAVGLAGTLGLAGLLLSGSYMHALPSAVAALIFAVCAAAAAGSFYWNFTHRRR